MGEKAMTGGKASRSKGKRGEREAAALIRDLLGFDVRRRVRQHGGDSDLEGVPGWSVEVKNCSTLRINDWWTQACAQANSGTVPVLLYKVPRKGWRARWPLSVLLTEQQATQWTDIDYTADTTVEGWAAAVRNSWLEGNAHVVSS